MEGLNMPEIEVKKINNKLTKIEVKEKLKSYIEELGIWNLNYTAIGEKLGITRQTVKKHIESYVANADLTKLAENAVALDLSYKKGIKELLKILADNKPSPSVKIRAVGELSRINEGFISFLERFELKPLPVQRTFNVNVDIDEEKFKQTMDKWLINN